MDQDDFITACAILALVVAIVLLTMLIDFGLDMIMR